LFHNILVDQFSRLRDGDRFFYLNESMTSAEQSILNAGNTLAKVITARTGITNLQADVFRFLAQEDGKTKGYYTNKNGQAELTGSQNGTTLTATLHDALVAALSNPAMPGFLVLQDASGNYEPVSFFDSYANVKAFLQTNGASMANKLSVQLLTAEINVALGKVDAASSIYVPAVTVSGQAMSSTLQTSLQTNGVSNPSGIANVQAL